MGALAIVVLPRAEPRGQRGWSVGVEVGRSERRFVGHAGVAGLGRPRVVGGPAATRATETAGRAAGTAAESTGRPAGPGDLGGRAAQRGTDVIHVDLVNRALLALLGL